MSPSVTTLWTVAPRPEPSTARTVDSATDRRLPTLSTGSPGHSSAISDSLRVGRPRRVTRILTRSRALRDCHASAGTGSPPRDTRNPPSVWIDGEGST